MHFTDFNSFVMFFGSLAGAGALITCIVNICKTVGWVKDGQAPVYVVGFNLVGLVALFVVGVIRPDVNIQGLDTQAGQIAGILMLVFGFIWQNFASKFSHDKVLKGTPVIGASFTYQAELARIKAFAHVIAQRATPT
jgi:hypothetical protein